MTILHDTFSRNLGMKKQTGFGFVLAAAIGLFATATPALATPMISQTITLNQVYTGSIPDGSAPWLQATFTQTGSNTGTLTLTSDLKDSDALKGLPSAKATIGWAFFLNQSASITGCTGICGNTTSGFNAITFKNGKMKGGFNSGPVPGGFNLAFGWHGAAGGNFVAGSIATYTLTFSSDLTSNPFVDNSDSWMSVAHVQSIGRNASCSGWIVSGTGTLGTSSSCGGGHNVPEPGSLGMLGLGALLVGLFVTLRRRYS